MEGGGRVPGLRPATEGAMTVQTSREEKKDATGMGFVEALLASGPNPDHADDLELFGQFVGTWELDWTGYSRDGTETRARGEWLFSWVLDGRAVQDIWIVPSRAERDRGDDRPGEYGSTLRFYDARIEAWRCVWVGPSFGNIRVFTVRQTGDEIWLEGHNPDGHQLRWIFSEITKTSFHWRDEVTEDEGSTWFLQEEMDVRRR
jgi:hypothetical protein